MRPRPLSSARMFDVFGNVIDRGAALSDFQLRSVHQAPPPLARRSTKSEIFETGIKAIDVLMPLALVESDGRNRDFVVRDAQNILWHARSE